MLSSPNVTLFRIVSLKRRVSCGTYPIDRRQEGRLLGAETHQALEVSAPHLHDPPQQRWHPHRLGGDPQPLVGLGRDIADPAGVGVEDVEIHHHGGQRLFAEEPG